MAAEEPATKLQEQATGKVRTVRRERHYRHQQLRVSVAHDGRRNSRQAPRGSRVQHLQFHPEAEALPPHVCTQGVYSYSYFAASCPTSTTPVEPRVSARWPHVRELKSRAAAAAAQWLIPATRCLAFLGRRS